MITPSHPFGSGAVFAVPGAAFLLYSLISATVAVVRLLTQWREAGNTDPFAVGKVVGELLITLAARGLTALPALFALTFALVAARYRVAWFRQYLIWVSAPLFLLFPVGSGFAIYFIRYVHKRRSEFGRIRSLPPGPKVIGLMVLGLSLWASSLAQETQASAPGKDPAEFVEVAKHIPGLVVDLPYATENNFFKKKFYAANRCYLRRGVVEKLALVQQDLATQGLGLKLWDGYRPRRVQYEFWKAMPDPRYVADPKQGSRHNRGAAVDATLVDLETGEELPMPTAYDDFTPRAAANFGLLPAVLVKNRKILHDAMARHGFSVLPTEWWHFDAAGWEKYPLEDIDLVRPAP